MVQWDWCLYVWDFERKKLIVLDPVSMEKGHNFLVMKHSETAKLMHSAMKYCKDHFFPYSQENMDDWHQEYVDIKGANGNRKVVFLIVYSRN